MLKNLQLNAGASYVERLGIGVPSYVRVDLGLTWRPRETLDVTLGVQNLFDNQHFEYGGTRTTNVIAEVPRTYFGQLTWKF